MPFKLSTLRPAGSEKWHVIGAGSVVSSMSELGLGCAKTQRGATVIERASLEAHFMSAEIGV